MDAGLKAQSVKQANPLHTKDEAPWGAPSDGSEGIDAMLPGKTSRYRL